MAIVSEGSALIPILRVALIVPIVSAMISGAGAQQPPMAPPVTVAKPVVKDIVEWDEFTGRFDAVGAVEIRARVGGYLTARSIHDLCLAHGVPVFCGGLLETGIGRAMNLALACLPGFTLPGDISATSRYFAHDSTQPFELVDGHLVPPSGPGSGAVLDPDVLEDVTVSVTSL